jgi:hypothetical protein
MGPLSVAHNVAFFFCAIVILLLLARRLGWLLSKRMLYFSADAALLIVCALWGIAVGVVVDALIQWLDPYWLLKWIFGYAMGAYASSPSFGLMSEATLPPGMAARYGVMTNGPVLVYVVALVVLHFVHGGGPI